jgi:hypothetical protein
LIAPSELAEEASAPQPAILRARSQIANVATVAADAGPHRERNGQYRHGERTKAAIADRQKFSALLKMLRRWPDRA